MEFESFFSWRSRLGLSQQRAADSLGLGLRQVQNFESDRAPSARANQFPSRAVRLAMAYLSEHPKELATIRAAPLLLPLNEIQQQHLAMLADDRRHKMNRKIGMALVRRRLAKDLEDGFAITPEGRATLKD